MAMLPIAQDLAMLVRTILVNATYGSEAAKEIPRLQENVGPSDTESITKSSKVDWTDDSVSTANTYLAKSEWSFSGTTVVVQREGDEGPDSDQPRLRFWFRRMHDGIVVSFLAAFGIGLAGSCLVIAQRHDPVKTRRNQILR